MQHGDYDNALASFEKSTPKDSLLKSKVLYNQGNAAFLKQDYEKAVESYKQSLAISPQDKDAKWNLELAITRLKLQKKKQDQDKKSKNKKKKKTNQKMKWYQGK